MPEKSPKVQRGIRVLTTATIVIVSTLTLTTTAAEATQNTATFTVNRSNCHPPEIPSTFTGVTISTHCQTGYATKHGALTKTFPVSTGKQGHQTRTGHFRVTRNINHWTESNLYPGAMMYRPAFFSKGQALHGSATDALVKSYPDSHGCVRIKHNTVNWLWANGYMRVGGNVTVT
jgi:lipoprotein-anchoring transpeptidase ErfK/SrfK